MYFFFLSKAVIPSFCRLSLITYPKVQFEYFVLCIEEEKYFCKFCPQKLTLWNVWDTLTAITRGLIFFDGVWGSLPLFFQLKLCKWCIISALVLRICSNVSDLAREATGHEHINRFLKHFRGKKNPNTEGLFQHISSVFPFGCKIWSLILVPHNYSFHFL